MSLTSTPTLLYDAVALFEKTLNMARTTATTTCEVAHLPNRLPAELKVLICQGRRLIRVTMLLQCTADKLALNQLHRCIRRS
jgi:hypothetical protein